jgi:hypothetical protein
MREIGGVVLMKLKESRVLFLYLALFHFIHTSYVTPHLLLYLEVK